jgi:pyruvate dehydrogenase E1 component alpha subunit
MGAKELDRDRLVWMYDQMLRIREFEERVKRTFIEHPGVIRGHTHLAAEARCRSTDARPRTSATYRAGYPLTRGPEAMMRRSRRKDGLWGIGGSMHLRCLERLLRHSGSSCWDPHATGAAGRTDKARWSVLLRRHSQGAFWSR